MGGSGWQSHIGRMSPFLLPEFEAGSLGAAFCVGTGDREGDLTLEFCGIFGKSIRPFIPRDAAVAWAPGDCDCKVFAGFKEGS